MQIYMETNYVKKNRGVTFCSALCQDDPTILILRLWGGRSMTDFSSQVCFYYIGSVFRIFVMLKNEAHQRISRRLQGASGSVGAF